MILIIPLFDLMSERGIFLFIHNVYRVAVKSVFFIREIYKTYYERTEVYKELFL